MPAASGRPMSRPFPNLAAGPDKGGLLTQYERPLAASMILDTMAKFTRRLAGFAADAVGPGPASSIVPIVDSHLTGAEGRT